MADTSTNAKLNELLNSKKDIFNLTGRHFDYEVKLSKISCRGIIFTNCSFQSNVDINDSYFESGLAFVNCTFNQKLFIENSNATVQKLEDWKFNDSISFLNTTINDVLVIHKVAINNNFTIEKSTINKFETLYFVSNFGGFSLSDSTFKNTIDLTNCKMNSEWRIESCQAESQVRVAKIYADSYTFLRNDFKRDCRLWAGEARNGITFNEGTYKEDFVIEAVKSNNPTSEYVPTLTFFDSVFKKYCVVYYTDRNDSNITGGCPHIYISSSDFENALIIEGIITNGQKTEIDKVSIDASKKLRGELVFNDLSIKTFKASGANYEASIILNNILFENLIFNYFSNYAKLQFVEVSAVENKYSCFQILNSFIGNSQFSNVNFSNFTDVIIENSDLSQISTSCVTWFSETHIDNYYNRTKIKGLVERYKQYIRQRNKHPELILAIKKANKKSTINSYRQKRELYRQLKYSLDKQGDKFQSLVFKQYEMKAFKKELQLTKKLWDRDRIILWLNQSNQFGQNWKRPVYLAIIFTIIFYCLLMIFSNPSFHFKPANNVEDINSTLKLWRENAVIGVQMLNPLLDINKIFIEPPPTFNMHVITYMHKLILSYLIFQTITAFRKYHQ